MALAMAETSAGLRRLAVVVAVGQDDHGASPALALADAPRGLRDRVVQRRGAEGYDARHRIGSVRRPVVNRSALVEVRVERIDRRFVAQTAEARLKHVRCRLARVRQVAFDAAADIEPNGDADARQVALQIADGS